MPCRPECRTCVGIAGAGQGHAVLLPAAQVDALLSNLRLIACSLGASAALCVTLLVGQLACKLLPWQTQFAGRLGWLLCARLVTNHGVLLKAPTRGQHVQVRLQGARLQHGAIPAKRIGQFGCGCAGMWAETQLPERR